MNILEFIMINKDFLFLILGSTYYERVGLKA